MPQVSTNSKALLSNFGSVQCRGAIDQGLTSRSSVVAGKGFEFLRVLLHLAHAGGVLMACRISPRAAKRRSILPDAQQENRCRLQSRTNPSRLLEAWPSWPIVE